jgi:hypothetical protein
LAGTDGVGLSFEFEPQPAKGRYYSLKPKIASISVPGLPPEFSDEEATRFLLKLLTRTEKHESIHIRVAVRVALTVQQTPEFQALGADGLQKAARAIEGYVNSLADVRTDHGHARIHEIIWEASGERQIQRAIDRAIKLRLKDSRRFDKKLKRLMETSGRQLDPEEVEDPDPFKQDIYEDENQN